MPDIIAGVIARQRRQGDQEGAAAVEFALVSVMLFMILFGIIQYGFFFFQLSSAHSAVAAAARQVELGDISNCAAWQQQTRDRLALSKATAVSWARSEGTGALVRGDRVTVTVDWKPVRIGAGLVPFPGSGQQRQTLELQVDHLGTETTIWDATPGCPP